MLQEIESLIASDRLNDSLQLLNSHIAHNPTDSRALFLRGKVYWRLGNRSAAQNDYMASAAIDPEGPARAALEYAREIEAFFNPDLLNP